MEDLESTSQELIPSEAEGTEINAAALQGARAGEDELPLVVWLLGTEPWFGDFNLEADEVMQRLGIKRSRLTQISGKELRVGRVRRGRYVSPVFREEDVERYLAWVRAPASHIKSSGVLQDAASALMQQAEDIERIFSQFDESWTEKLESGIRRAFLHSTHTTAELREQVKQEFKAALRNTAEQLSVVTIRQDKLAKQLNSLQSASEKIQAGQMMLLQSLQESHVRSTDLVCKRMEQIEAQIAAWTARIEDENEMLPVDRLTRRFAAQARRPLRTEPRPDNACPPQRLRRQNQVQKRRKRRV